MTSENHSKVKVFIFCSMIKIRDHVLLRYGYRTTAIVLNHGTFFGTSHVFNKFSFLFLVTCKNLVFSLGVLNKKNNTVIVHTH